MAHVVAMVIVATASSPAVALTPTTYLGTTSGTTLGGPSYGQHPARGFRHRRHARAVGCHPHGPRRRRLGCDRV